MKIVCFPHFFYLSEVSRLIEIGHALRKLEQEVVFFSHGGPYESFAREVGFEVVSITPTMSPKRANEYMTYNHGEGSKSLSSSFFTCEEFKAWVRLDNSGDLLSNKYPARVRACPTCGHTCSGESEIEFKPFTESSGKDDNGKTYEYKEYQLKIYCSVCTHLREISDKCWNCDSELLGSE